MRVRTDRGHLQAGQPRLLTGALCGSLARIKIVDDVEVRFFLLNRSNELPPAVQLQVEARVGVAAEVLSAAAASRGKAHTLPAHTRAVISPGS